MTIKIINPGFLKPKGRLYAYNCSISQEYCETFILYRIKNSFSFPVLRAEAACDNVNYQTNYQSYLKFKRCTIYNNSTFVEVKHYTKTRHQHFNDYYH